MRAWYPLTIPRDSSRRTRDCTADTDRPARRQVCQRRLPVGDEFAGQDTVDLVELRLPRGGMGSPIRLYRTPGVEQSGREKNRESAVARMDVHT